MSAPRSLTHCLRGHAMAEYAETVRSGATTRRRCLLCRKLREGGDLPPATHYRCGHPRTAEWGRHCKPCQQAMNRAWYQRNKDAAIAKAQAWRRSHLPRVRELDRADGARRRAADRVQRRAARDRVLDRLVLVDWTVALGEGRP